MFDDVGGFVGHGTLRVSSKLAQRFSFGNCNCVPIFSSGHYHNEFIIGILVPYISGIDDEDEHCNRIIPSLFQVLCSVCYNYVVHSGGKSYSDSTQKKRCVKKGLDS